MKTKKGKLEWVSVAEVAGVPLGVAVVALAVGSIAVALLCSRNSPRHCTQRATPTSPASSMADGAQKTGGNQAVSGTQSGDVVFMTSPLFAKGTKNPNYTPHDQEALFSDQLVLVRHGERQDHVDRTWKGTNLLPLYDPPLSNDGRKQSFETALKYYSLLQEKRVEERIRGSFSLFLVSPFTRCIETAVIINVVAFNGSLAMFVDPMLSDWQQTKVFRTAPTLGGYYTVPGRRQKNAKELLFHPPVEALRASLVPFFQSRGLDENLAEHSIPPEAAKRWVRCVERWLDTHHTLPVWTSDATEDALQSRINALKPGAGGSSPEPAGSAPSNSKGTGKKTVGDGGEAAVAQCGVSFPEGKADLLRRCERVVQTHFLRGDNGASQSMVPASVAAAVAKERRDKLPKYFQGPDEQPAEFRELAGPPALLPPMHVMAVTHADIVSGVLEACCPKHHTKTAGYSVPYCSTTILTRHNNYYRIPPLEERHDGVDRGSGGGDGAGKRSSGGKANMRGKQSQRCGATAGAKAPGVLVAKKSAPPPAPLPVDWKVEEVGNTAQLRTRIVIQYDK